MRLSRLAAVSLSALAALVGLHVLLLVATVEADRARAHEHWISKGGFADPESGHSCCGLEDCAPLPAAEVSRTPGGYVLKRTGETIPHSRALASQDGQYWRCRYLTGEKEGQTRCFFKVEPGM